MATGLGAISEAQGFGAQLARKTVEFDGSTGGGEAGTAITLFTVTSGVHLVVVGVCTESLTVSDGATVEVGTVANPAVLIATTTAANIDNGEVWFDASPAEIEVLVSIGGAFVAGGADIVLAPNIANVTDGTIVFTCFWTPLTDDGYVVAA